MTLLAWLKTQLMLTSIYMLSSDIPVLILVSIFLARDKTVVSDHLYNVHVVWYQAYILYQVPTATSIDLQCLCIMFTGIHSIFTSAKLKLSRSWRRLLLPLHLLAELSCEQASKWLMFKIAIRCSGCRQAEWYYGYMYISISHKLTIVSLSSLVSLTDKK